jgi:hypothetical protein
VRLQEPVKPFHCTLSTKVAPVDPAKEAVILSLPFKIKRLPICNKFALNALLPILSGLVND